MIGKPLHDLYIQSVNPFGGLPYKMGVRDAQMAQHTALAHRQQPHRRRLTVTVQG